MKVIVRINNKEIYVGSIADIYNLSKLNIGSYAYEGSSGFTFEIKDNCVVVEYYTDYPQIFINGERVEL